MITSYFVSPLPLAVFRDEDETRSPETIFQAEKMFGTNKRMINLRKEAKQCGIRALEIFPRVLIRDPCSALALMAGPLPSFRSFGPLSVYVCIHV